MNITVTHPVSNFTGNVTLADGAVVLGFTSGSCQQDVNPAYFGAIKSAGLSYVIGAPNPAPPYDANMDVVTAAIVGSSSSSTSGALRAAYVTPNAIRVADYGTLGTADDSATINAALAAASGRHLIFPPNATLNTSGSTLTSISGAIIDGNGCTLQLTGVGANGLTIAGTCDNLETRNLRIKGSAVVSDAHGGVVAPSGGTLSNIRVINCYVRDVTLGISFSADTSGTLVGLLLQGNYLKNIVGTSAGSGYGLHWSISDTVNPSGVQCIGNMVLSAQRHGIYCAKAQGATIVGNQVLNHRDANKTGSLSPAIFVARSANVSVIGNTVVRPAGGGIHLGGPNPSTIAGPYEVIGNTFADAQDSVGLVYIGQSAPGTDGIPQHVDFAFNSLQSSAGDLLTVYNGKYVRVANNRFKLTATGNGIYVQGAGVTGADYFDQFEASQNYFDVGSTNGIRLSGTETLTSAMRFRGNRRTTTDPLFTVSVNITNPNIDVQDQLGSGLSFSAGVSTVQGQMLGPSQTTAPAAGGASALPATPAGYLTVNVNGTDRKLPYY